jgi:pimeloyl-ACP methyl ester carboxylesterase
LTYADRHPERVSRLVLLATFMDGSFFVDAKWKERYAGIERMWEFARSDWQAPAARAAVVEWMHPKASEVERRVLMALLQTSADGVSIANFRSAKINASEAARRIHIPNYRSRQAPKSLRQYRVPASSSSMARTTSRRSAPTQE